MLGAGTLRVGMASNLSPLRSPISMANSSLFLSSAMAERGCGAIAEGITWKARKRLRGLEVYEKTSRGEQVNESVE